MIYSNIAELIGNTPLLELVNFEKNNHLKAHVVAKIESFNPAGSAKDRIAKAMLETAQREGKLDDDTVLIEPTSGNTGIALAALAAARGNRTIIVMPETMSVERRFNACLRRRSGANRRRKRHGGCYRKSRRTCQRISQFSYCWPIY